MASPEIPTIDDVRTAAERITGHARRTPVMTSESLSQLAGADLVFKCEPFQRGGAFKFRGACNAVFGLPADVAARGVVTHSSGNHAAALALAAQIRGIPAFVVMPRNTPGVKQAAVAAAGGRITLCEPTLAAREAAANALLAQTGATLIHPYDNAMVIAGQGTLALELHEQAPDLEAVVVPVSGGGLISGVAVATASVRPAVDVLGAEPERADDAARSMATGRIEPAGPGDTIADGLRATLSERTFTVMRRHVHAVVTASEADIIRAMRLLWEQLKVVVEPSGAVPFAAMLANPDRFRGRRVGVVLSGGNVDLDRLPWQ